MKKFAAYDDQAIWGIGDSWEQAMEDAANNLDRTRPEENELHLAEMNTAEMTDELAKQVIENGGNIAFGMLSSGLIGTSEEQYEDA